MINNVLDFPERIYTPAVNIGAETEAGYIRCLTPYARYMLEESTTGRWEPSVLYLRSVVDIVRDAHVRVRVQPAPQAAAYRLRLSSP